MATPLMQVAAVSVGSLAGGDEGVVDVATLQRSDFSQLAFNGKLLDDVAQDLRLWCAIAHRSGSPELT